MLRRFGFIGVPVAMVFAGLTCCMIAQDDPVREYHENGRLLSECRYDRNKQSHGLSEFWYADGKPRSKQMFDHGQLTEHVEYYWPSGRVRSVSRDSGWPKFEKITTDYPDQ